MADKSGIEWTDATWNPVVGCSIVSPGCTNCYAMQQAARIVAMSAKPGPHSISYSSHYAGLTTKVKGLPVWTGRVALAPDHILTAPLRWKKPRRIFVNSMGDLFHEAVPDEWIDRVFAVMALSPQHSFQVLTKRAKRMREYISRDSRSFLVGRAIVDMTIDQVIRPNDANYPFPYGQEEGNYEIKNWPLPNCWLGVSAEDQARADERIPELLATPAAVRWVSAEPLLGSVDFTAWLDVDARTGSADDGPFSVLDWIVVGGESGSGARPMHPDWARSIRDQCAAAGVPFFMKQLSGINGRAVKDLSAFPVDLQVRNYPDA